MPENRKFITMPLDRIFLLIGLSAFLFFIINLLLLQPVCSADSWACAIWYWNFEPAMLAGKTFFALFFTFGVSAIVLKILRMARYSWKTIIIAAIFCLLSYLLFGFLLGQAAPYGAEIPSSFL